MSIEKIKINEDFCFQPGKSHTISFSNSALKLYMEVEPEAIELSGDLPIFLDTNVLLLYYGMANTEKEKLLNFFEKYRHRIILTRHIEKEFIKNRVSVIHKTFFQPFKQIVSEYDVMRNSIVGQINTFKNKRKKIFEADYPDLWEKLNNIESKIKSIIYDDEDIFKLEIQAAVNNTTKANNNIEISDELLKICSEFKITDSLEEDEINFLQEHYKKLLNDFKDPKKKHNYNLSFPGCGEKKDDNVEGDFIIYHEMIKYMKNNQTSCIFLTNDTTKGDWLQENNRPFVHHIENTYLLTEKVMFVSHAEFSLRNIKFENVHKQNYEDVKKANFDMEITEEEFSEVENEYVSSDCLMRMVLTNQSMKANLEFNIYYHVDTRGYREHSYIGLYGNKAIRAIGKISNVVKAHLDENSKLIVDSSKKALTMYEEKRILAAINEAYTREWDISEDHVFFCVEQFYETKFIKNSLHAPMGTRIFNLGKILNIEECTLETSEIARLLREKEWK